MRRNLAAAKHPGGIGFNAVEHGSKHFKTFPLIFLFGIALAVTSKANAIAQVIHIHQMIFPAAVQLF